MGSAGCCWYFGAELFSGVVMLLMIGERWMVGEKVRRSGRMIRRRGRNDWRNRGWR